MVGTNTCEGKSVTVDAAGNVLTTGTLRGTADFDPGPGVYNLTSAGEADIYISKLNANGDFLWAKRVGNPSTDQGESVAVDAAGNVYITGWFSPGGLIAMNVPLPVDFDPGPGVFDISSLTIAIFVLKLDADGNFVWAKSMQGDNTEYGTSLGIDGAGNLFITGAFNGTVDFDPGPGNVSLTQQGGPSQSDIFLTKWDLSGNMIWVKQMGGTSAEYPFKLAIDATGNILLTGYFNGTTDLDPGPGIFNLTSAGSTDIYICKLNNDGNFIWAKRMGGPANESCYGITADLFGNIFIATPISSLFDVDPGPGTTNVSTVGGFDALISKYSPNGDFIWARKWGASGNDDVFDIKTDAAGNVYTGGSFSGTIDFDPTPVEVIRTATGGNDMFYIKLDANGNFVWVAQLPGIAGTIYSLYVNAANEIFSTGLFSGMVDFDPGPGVYNLTSSSSDVFVNKFGQGAVQGPLPVHLVNFSAMDTDEGNALHWNTNGEINTSLFAIEWSSNGQDFQQIGEQKAAENSTQSLSYQYLHRVPADGDNYYRLRIIDKDGQFTLSKIVRVNNIARVAVVSAFPNPFYSKLSLNINVVKNDDVTFYLHSSDGKIIASRYYKLIKGNNQVYWNLAGVPPGNYYIESPDLNVKAIQVLKK